MNKMSYPNLATLPPAPAGRTGWPWTVETPQAPPTMPDGAPWPTITMITPSYNQGRYLEEAIRSILLQGYPALEYFVMDGGSSDESVSIIKKYSPWITHWVSEPDQGQPHALQKGLDIATGELFNFINSDDLLTEGALQHVASHIGDADMIAGGCQHFTASGDEPPGRNQGLSARALVAYVVSTNEKVECHQSSMWLRRALVEQCGGIDLELQYQFDWDLFVRYLVLFPKVTYSAQTLARFRLHETSKTVSESHHFDLERPLVLRKLLASPRFSLVHPECREFLRGRGWWSELDHLHQTHKGLWKAVKILQASCADPGYRWSRMTLGAVRRALQEATGLAQSSRENDKLL